MEKKRESWQKAIDWEGFTLFHFDSASWVRSEVRMLRKAERCYLGRLKTARVNLQLGNEGESVGGIDRLPVFVLFHRGARIGCYESLSSRGEKVRFLEWLVSILGEPSNN